MERKLSILAALLSATLISSSLFAQKAEINPYVGFYWPSSNSTFGSFENDQLLGVRGGYYITPGFELGGNFGWSNHFQPSSSDAGPGLAGTLGFPQGKVRANIWELEFTYNFGRHSFGSAAVRPYLVGGAGGLTTSAKDPDTFVLTVRPVEVPGTTLFFTNDVLRSSETFFTLSYGGGIKAQRVWGPLGFFGDIRGRTVPNFFSTSLNWPELSAGLTFSWGER